MEITKIGGVDRTPVYLLELDSLNIFIISFEHPYILIASFRVLHILIPGIPVSICKFLFLATKRRFYLKPC